MDSVDETAASRRALKVAPYSFRNPPVMNKAEMNCFTRVHEAFCRRLSYRSYSRLKASIDAHVVSCEVVPSDRLSATLPTPTYVAYLSMEPGGTRIFIRIGLPVALVIVSALLGGEGAPEGTGRSMTAIELTVAESFADLLATQLRFSWEDSGAWTGSDGIRLNVDSQDMEPDLLQIFPPPAQVINATLSVRAGEVETEANVCYSYPGVQPFLDRLAGRGFATVDGEEGAKDAVEHVLTVPLELRTVIGRGVLPAGQIQSLEPGTVICLDNDIDSLADVYINNSRCFKAQWGQRRGRAAVKLTERCRQEEQ